MKTLAERRKRAAWSRAHYYRNREAIVAQRRARRTLTYSSWAHMKGRCQNPTDPKFPLYGARGITVCERWQVYENFLTDMGPRPSRRHSIDRIENAGNYEPGNCRWATTSQQARNTRRNRLTPEKVSEIRSLLERGVTQTRIANGFGVSQATISSIKLGKLWRADGQEA